MRPTSSPRSRHIKLSLRLIAAPVITGEYLELFREEFASRWGEQCDFVHKALESSRSAVVKLKAASVHAEAALMSLVSGDLRKREVDVSGMPMPIAGLLPVSALRVRPLIRTHAFHLLSVAWSYPCWAQRAMLLLLLAAG